MVKINIKETLKRNGITLMRFANDFDLSRNTLLVYIEKFENNEIIPKIRYQKVFERLFSSDVSKETFMLTYTQLSKLFLNHNSDGKSNHETIDTNEMMSLMRKFNKALINNKIDEYDAYVLNIILDDNSHETIFKCLAKYFYFFNHCTRKDYFKLTEEEKIIFTNYFLLFTMQKYNNLNLNKAVEELFLSRLDDMEKLKKIGNILK